MTLYLEVTLVDKELGRYDVASKMEWSVLEVGVISVWVVLSDRLR